MVILAACRGPSRRCTSTPTASPQKASRSRCSSCCSINGCADRSPTAASTIAPIPNTDPTAASKPPITAPTKPSNTSSTFSPPLNSAVRQSRSRFVYNRSGKNLRFFADCCCEKGAPSGQLASRPHCITVPFMSDGLSTLYQDLLSGSYDCVDRIVLNAYFRMGHDPGGFRLWWRQLTGSDATLDNAHVMRLAGRFGRRIRGYAKVNDIPVVNCSAGERKHDIAEDYLARTTITQGLFLVLVGRAQAPVWDVTANHHIEKKKPMPYVNHYSFHILDAEWGHITIKISGHPPFPAQIMLNGHEYVACQARKAGITFTKQGNCFTNVSRAAALAKIAETLSEPRTIGRLSQLYDRWIYSECLCFALDLEEQRLSGFRYQYSNYQIEYSRNLIFAVGGHMEQVFQALIDRSRVRLDLKTVKTILGYKRRPKYRSRKKRAAEWEVAVERPTYDLTIFKLHCGGLTLKIYSKGERVLRIEVIVHNTRELGCGRTLETFPEIVRRLQAGL